MFTLFNYIVFGVVGIGLIVLSICLCVSIGDGYSRNDKKPKLYKVLIMAITFVLIVAMIGGCGAYNTHTESGKRAVKSWDSETSGGIERTVTVYDIKGEEVAKYHGKFDVEESSSNGIVKIKFDVDGKRHIIYAQTGTVLIDED